MSAPTNNDYIVFDSISLKDRFRIIKGYLWLNNTQVAVGQDVFPYDADRACGEKVSTVMRCYGFGGENHGVFRRWGISGTVTDDDIREFVSRYPNGCRYGNGDGAEMYNFLTQTINKRLEAERTQRQRQQAAAEAQRRAEEAQRQAQLAYEREQRRIAEEAERKEREYRQQQEALKNQAKSLISRATAIINSAATYQQLIDGVEMFRQGLSISWTEPVNLYGHVYESTYFEKKTDVYLGACADIVEREYNNGNYQNVMKYGQYICGKLEPSNSQESIIQDCVAGNIVKNRALGFYPEARSLTYMAKACMKTNNVKDGVRCAEMATSYGSVTCMEMLGDYYAQFNSKDNLSMSCYYFEMAKNIDDPGLQKKIKAAQQRLLAILSPEVESVMSAYSPDWLPAPLNSSDSWEAYSNLPDETCSAFYRQTKKKGEILVIMDEEISCFKRCGYTPGQIDLSALWEVYREAHVKVERKLLFLKKKKYNGDLREGDFVDCIKYLWEKKYHMEKEAVPNPVTYSAPATNADQAQAASAANPVPEKSPEQIRQETAAQLYNKSRACRKNNDVQGELAALTEAENYGSADAVNRLGCMYMKGEGVEKNIEKAVSLFEQGADQGNKEAMGNLGRCYLSGVGVEKDKAKGIDLLKRSAELGNINSMLFLAEMYAKSRNPEQHSEALRYYEMAAERGIDTVKMRVAQALDVEENKANGSADLAAAKKWYTAVIDCTNDDSLKLEAAKRLDKIYREKDGSVLRDALDSEKAYVTYAYLSSKGNKEAMERAAFCLETRNGVDRDMSKALDLYEKLGLWERAEYCRTYIRKNGNIFDAAHVRQAGELLKPVGPDIHTNNNEYYLNSHTDSISEYEGLIYYIPPYEENVYLCASRTDGTDIRIIAKLHKKYEYANVHVNVTGIYVYIYQDLGKVMIAHYSFKGELISECTDSYPGGYTNGHSISDLRFYDSKAYYVYRHSLGGKTKECIKCMDIDNNRVWIVYRKAARYLRLFALENKLIFKAEYENDNCEVYSRTGWMILDLWTKQVECLSNPYCNLENIVDDPKVYDADSSKYNEDWKFDRHIACFDFRREIFWTDREETEGLDSKHIHYVAIREPRALWGDRDAVISDMPIWRVFKDTMTEYEFFNGERRYTAPKYYVFKSHNVRGDTFTWSNSNDNHGECQQFRVIGEYLYLDVDTRGEKQHEMTYIEPAVIRDSWFGKKLDNEVIDSFKNMGKKPSTKSVKPQADSDSEYSGNTDSSGSYEASGDLRTEKIIGNSDIKYSILTLGTKFHIGFGVPVIIVINGHMYNGKTSNSAKGRIDGMKKLFAENDIKLGDRLEATYCHENKTITLTKI